jgi:hypothetical protein
MRPGRAAVFTILVVAVLAPRAARCQPGESAPWLADRGAGIRTSIFGTYVRGGELLVSPFFEYYKDDDFEYKPSDFGHGLAEDFRGRYRAKEGLLFVTYGLTDRLAIEFEAAVISAELTKAADDPSTMPQRLEESGPGDWQVQLDWTLLPESATRPELVGFFEVVPPTNENKPLIGSDEWEYKAGGGVIRGMNWGTVTARAAVQYVQGGPLDPGEYALEYLKRLSARWRVYAGIEGNQDEVELIGEAQLHFSERAYLRLNTSFGLTSKATDWAPDVGLVFAFPIRRSTRGD